MTSDNGKHTDAPKSLEDIIDDMMLDPDMLQALSTQSIHQALQEYGDDVSLEKALSFVRSLSAFSDTEKEQSKKKEEKKEVVELKQHKIKESDWREAEAHPSYVSAGSYAGKINELSLVGGMDRLGGVTGKGLDEPGERFAEENFAYLWEQAQQGNSSALDKLTAFILPDLQRIAQLLLSKERPNHTLTTNALINELYLRLLVNESVTIHDRSHFLALASKRMRFVLIDYARKSNYQKNNSGQRTSSFDESIYRRDVATKTDVDNLMDIDKALAHLEKLNPAWARVVELRYFGGCQFKEIAEIMDINQRRAERYWSHAKNWLYNYLNE